MQFLGSKRMASPSTARLLRIDLSSRRAESEPVPASWSRRFVGGKGLAARYLYDELDAGIDPLGPENALLFMPGPLTGTVPGESRYAVVTKSPLTGTFLDSYSGGSFPDHLAAALGNHVGVLFTGASADPVSVRIEDGDATVEPTDELWGSTVEETCDAFERPTACIGPAGEREVRYATVASDGGDHHAGRGGAGAVMGSKGMKAVVAVGEPGRGEAESNYGSTDIGRWQTSSETLETVDFANEVGVLPTRGWQEGSFEGADDIGIESARERAVARENPDDEVAGGFRVESSEGETVPRGATAISLGSGLGIDDFDAVAVLGAACDDLGLDLISAGNAVAWTIRAATEGVLSRDIEFGDDEAARDLLEEVAYRSSELGDVLADGVDAAAARYGGETLVPTVKAMDLPTYDPRGAPAMALAYATSDRGACHRRARPVLEEVFAAGSWTDERRAEAVIEEQDLRSLLWSLVVDDFAGEALWNEAGAEWLHESGIGLSADELRRVGERVWTLTRLFNVREGFDREDDALPAMLAEPLRGGPNDGAQLDPEEFERLLSVYYEKRGWDETGRPTRSLLSRLGLDSVVDDETPVGKE
ncbi:aldehyde ferredoxin oxidoreductase [Haladaptatus paucihalophilus DX253]|uniref:Aldehyde ferredoxin oxidoreductase n=2 Tax=Haladaptatus paucihalophilus TaxID=367189 RepID=E7QSI8_HALPU|nr:aldehyde ferredoxin oxidoreductase [Haladaptatus paucihalophilus DX253]SHK05068.1 aldehyde:ferredoxin oxidoreductase [Haladaptatus paucihalophilus DX253]